MLVDSLNKLFSFFHDKENLIQLLKEFFIYGNLKLKKEIKVKGNIYHPQGMVKLKKHFFISSVSDFRNKEKGTGFLFKLNEEGEFISKIILGSGNLFHPGGIDIFRKNLYIPISQYEPYSKNKVLLYNIVNDDIEVLFEFKDHLGCLFVNKKYIVGLNWGGQDYYIWDRNSLELLKHGIFPLSL